MSSDPFKNEPDMQKLVADIQRWTAANRPEMAATKVPEKRDPGGILFRSIGIVILLALAFAAIENASGPRKSFEQTRADAKAMYQRGDTPMGYDDRRMDRGRP